MTRYQPAGKAPSVAALLTAATVRSRRAAISFRPKASQMLAVVIGVCSFSMSLTIVQDFCTGKRKMICRTTFLYDGYSSAMNIEQKMKLARHGDMGREATAFRLRAAREAVALGQDQLARDMGEGMTKQKLRNAEKADNDPSKALMRYFYRAHRIDFNFLLHGDFAQLPADVQAKLFVALEALSNARDQTEDSDPNQVERPDGQ